MPHTTQEETNESSHLKRALIPTKTEIFSLLTGSFLVLLALNALPTIRTIDGITYTLTTEYIRNFTEKILAPTDNQQGSRILTVVLWMVIGMVVYIILWLLGSMFANYRKDIPMTKGMVLPRGYNSEDVWHETVLKLVIRFLSTVMFLYWIYLLLAAVLPYASLLFINSVADFNVTSIATILAATFILAASVFVLIVFARCIVLRERVFGS